MPRPPKRWYGDGLPGIDPSTLTGTLIVVEGADGAGRSTQIALMKEYLESRGHAVLDTGLKRSFLVAEELEAAQRGNVLARTTMSLFYATDFADQLENRIVPALRSGFVVLADRYIYTLMARAIVRGADRAWCESLYSIALVPDVVFYLKVSPRLLVERTFEKSPTLDYWESGMDMGLSRDMFESFVKYQRLLAAEFKRLQSVYGFEVVNGDRTIRAVAQDLQAKTEAVLAA